MFFIGDNSLNLASGEVSNVRQGFVFYQLLLAG
jgi:hypothetical protein